MERKEKLSEILKQLTPILNEGVYVFVSVKDISKIPLENVIGFFREKEGNTLVIDKATADSLKLSYYFTAAWITLEVHSSLQAVGFTAAFANALAKKDISCNVMAGYHHDHIFVDLNKADRALKVLRELSRSF